MKSKSLFSRLWSALRSPERDIEEQPSGLSINGRSIEDFSNEQLLDYMDDSWSCATKSYQEANEALEKVRATDEDAYMAIRKVHLEHAFMGFMGKEAMRRLKERL
jgi:hypothetical protein